MSDREVISVEEEQDQVALRQEREADLKFREQWKCIDDYPACPVGLTLLRHFAEEYPDLYDNFVALNPQGHQSLPALGRNPRWVEYRHHWGTCRDCMEA